MSPHEQAAREIVDLNVWPTSDGPFVRVNDKPRDLERLVSAIASALAASAAKVDTDPQDVAGQVHEHEYDGSGYYCTQCGRYDEQREKLDALTAKLEEITTNRDYWFNTAEAYLKEIHEETAKLQAMREALLAQVLAHDFAGDPCFCGDEARNPPLTEEHMPSCLQARAALGIASPEARATGEDSE